MSALQEMMETAAVLTVHGENGAWKKLKNLTSNKDGRNSLWDGKYHDCFSM